MPLEIMISGDTASSDVNGVWVHNGEVNGKARFTNDRSSSSSIQWNGTQWLITGSGGKYFGSSSGCLPPECDGVTTKWGFYALKVSHHHRNVQKSCDDADAAMRTQQFMERLCAKRKFADVTICCGSDSVEAHSCVLADSPVFEKMLDSPMVEGSSRIIKIDDFPVESVKQFVEILYTSKCGASCNWSDVLLLADKYQLPHVVQISLDRMYATASAETVVSYLRAINNTLHLPECQAAKSLMISRVKQEDELVNAMADAL